MSARETFDDGITHAPIFAGARLAYIRAINEREARDLGIIPSDVAVPAGIKLFCLHAADGTPLAVLDDKNAALGAAIQNELVPLSVH